MIGNPSELAHGAILSVMFVLNFHLIGKPKRALAEGEEDVSLERGQFVEILDAVSDRDDVLLTFDDGNRSDVTAVLPELQRRGLQAQFFICPARFGTAEFVDESDVRELQLAGMSVGSHGMDHVQWRKLQPSALDREIVQAKRVLEETLQTPIDAAACPFGAYDRRALRALRGAGFQRVYTSDGGAANAKEWLVARNTVRRSDSAESIERMLNQSSETASLALKTKRWIKRWR
jgi:peptidoglycan/xylan/chitin deacetylase (PgdA/CDA1 family)